MTRHNERREKTKLVKQEPAPCFGADAMLRHNCLEEHMLLKTIVPKHSIGSKAGCGLLLYKFRFFTSLIMPCHEKPRVG